MEPERVCLYSISNVDNEILQFYRILWHLLRYTHQPASHKNVHGLINYKFPETDFFQRDMESKPLILTRFIFVVW